MMKRLIAWGVLSILTVLSVSAQRGMRVRKDVPTDSIRLSDPAVLADKKTNMYYMTGTGGMMWRSSDLKLWEGPFRVTEFEADSWMGPRPMIWAAELHQTGDGWYYYFATFTNQAVKIDTVRGNVIERRASQVLRADNPMGPYRAFGDATYLPADRPTLDGTYWKDRDDKPYLVFCGEWLQNWNGTIEKIELKPDFGGTIGEPKVLFRANDSPWSRERDEQGNVTWNKVTDGPWLFRTGTGRLGMLWTSWVFGDYTQGVAYSESGTLDGPWTQEPEPITPPNFGHSMLFQRFDGQWMMSVHSHAKDARGRTIRIPHFFEVDLSGDKLRVIIPQTSHQIFQLTPDGYFNAGGTDVMAFSDFYPEGHQGGVCVIMNGRRIATNGDIRLEATPGQWQPVPRQLSRKVDGNRITTTLCYPDSSRHLTGFNPMVYPDWNVNYTVTVEPKDNGVFVTVDLDTPVPDFLLGKVGFNLEFYPGDLFGKPWLMDGQTGIFPQQPNGPLLRVATNRGHDGNFFTGRGQKADLAQLDGKGYSPLRADDIIAEPYAVGRKFTSCPDDAMRRLTVESLTEPLKLYDGRMNHNNGWFVLRSEIAKGATKGAVRWFIKPAVDEQWRYTPVIQTSQVGYLPGQPKHIVIETDKRENVAGDVQLVRIGDEGEKVVRTVTAKSWGKFLRYHYMIADFSDVSEPGLYQVRYGEAKSNVFRIADDVYDRGVWQPVVEYFLPVQMCHMRVSEKYRIWHDACHMDDALMARVGNHIDGYDQRPGLSKYKEGERVPGVNVGGWHDAGDFDLRVESQAGEAYILALAYEQFHPDIDVTAIDQQRHRVEIHEPDGKNDILQQVENGALTVVRSYQALGRLYRGIICSTLRQYAMLGDAAAMTDGQPNDDDRWIFTEDNPMRAISTAAQLAGAARVLRGYNDQLSRECLDIAADIYQQTTLSGRMASVKLQAAVELYLATGEQQYLDFILSQQNQITSSIGRTGWFIARIAKQLETKNDEQSKAFVKAFRAALAGYKTQLDQQSAETPYGVPYRPSIWGAGWDIQRFGFEYYFLNNAYPDIFPKETVYNALNFILGCHPGSNSASFASGVGAKSATVAYGLNRADWSYIPGGVVSGTALIRPDFPELLDFPFLWQQTEYVLGGGSSHYMFLVLAAKN